MHHVPVAGRKKKRKNSRMRGGKSSTKWKEQGEKKKRLRLFARGKEKGGGDEEGMR